MLNARRLAIAGSKGSKMAASFSKIGTAGRPGPAKALTSTMQTCANGDRHGPTVLAASASFLVCSRTEQCVSRVNRIGPMARGYFATLRSLISPLIVSVNIPKHRPTAEPGCWITISRTSASIDSGLKNERFGLSGGC